MDTTTARPDPAAALCISFKALQRARSTLEDFARSYFPYLGLQLPADFFRFLDVLIFVEGSIYQLDEDNEAVTGRGGADSAAAAAGVERIRGVLRQEGLLDGRIEGELAQGLRYWGLEQDLCRRLLAAPRPLEAPAGLTAAEVLECHSAKSFDYRVLFLLLCRLSRTPYDEQLLSFLRTDEMLVDISDDLVDYEDDVCANSFNIFRCYIHLYGRDAALKLAERISGLEAEHGRLLSGLPQSHRDHYWRRHLEACEGQGSDRWVFPPPIYDEAEYRERVREAEAEEAAAAAMEAAAAAAVAAEAPEAAAEMAAAKAAAEAVANADVEAEAAADVAAIEAGGAGSAAEGRSSGAVGAAPMGVGPPEGSPHGS